MIGPCVLIPILVPSHKKRNFVDPKELGMGKSHASYMRKRYPQLFNEEGKIDAGFFTMFNEWKVDVYNLAHNIYYALIDMGITEKMQIDFIMRTTHRSRDTWASFFSRDLFVPLEFGNKITISELIVEYIMQMSRLAYLIKKEER